MFLLQILPCRGIKSLIVVCAAISIAGCASLQPGPEPPVSAAVAIPLDQDSAPVEPSPFQQQSFVDFVDATNGQVPNPVDDGFDIVVETDAVSVDRAAEIIAKHKHMSKRDREEAQVVAEIEATLLEIKRADNAWYRLQQGMQFAPVDNKRVRAQLKWYLDNPDYMQRVMERARPILPFVLDELERRNLPSEIALLPIVESAYQAFAYSPGRASGLWQIIPSTGRFLGLKQNWWYDGRRDIIESTHAAINYLDSLARQFDGDWELALASYNAGPGRIRGAIRYNKKRKRPTDFWNLTKIRKETLDYVPKMFALRELFANPEKYKLDLVPVGNQVSYEIVELDGQIDLALAADLAGITMNELYQLNPAFNRWATAPEGPHRLLLPLGKAKNFELAVSRIPANKRINWVRHRIKNGENLGQISTRYSTTIALIREVNNLRGTQIRAGKYLMVPTATRSLQSYSLSQQSRINKIQNTNRSGNKKVHIVRSGQSLWSISRSYGVSTQALAKWNGVAPIDTLRVGQKLVLWTSGTNAQKVSISQTRPSNILHALRYTVRKGDSLYLIANRFNIKMADIKRWNRIGKYLQPGQKLKLYVDITSQSG